MRHAGLELLQARTSQLEKENKELRSELVQLTESTETAEGREKDLVDNVVFELSELEGREGRREVEECAVFFWLLTVFGSFFISYVCLL